MRAHVQDAVHVVRGRSAGAVLARHGMRTEVVDDSLVYGPVSLDQVEHGRVRTNFWRRERLLGPGLEAHGRFEGGRAHLAFPDLRSALVDAGARAVVLWLSPLWPDVLFYWWVSYGLVTSGIPRAKVLVARPRKGSWPGAMNPADIDAARIVGPLRSSEVRAAARLWEYFASPSPAALDRARRAQQPGAPGAALRYYGSLLPRLGKSAALFPSIADSWLLSAFADEKPAHTIVSNPWGREADQWLLNMGEEFIFTRLWRWAGHQHGRWLKSRPQPRRDLRYVRYTMTPECRELLQNGTRRRSDFAPLTLGGLHVADGRWLCVPESGGRRWRLFGPRSSAARRS